MLEIKYSLCEVVSTGKVLSILVRNIDRNSTIILLLFTELHQITTF